MKVAIYCRVSTDKQSVDMQLHDLRAYCALRKFEVFKEYVDEGVSGRKISRPALDELMKNAKRGRFKAVLVWSFDRMGRNLSHLLMVLKEFESLNIDFMSYTQNIDTTSPYGKLIYAVISALSEFEVEQTRERIKAGIQVARAKGVRLGRKRKHKIDMDRLKELQAQGLSYGKIAITVNLPKAIVWQALNRGVKNPL